MLMCLVCEWQAYATHTFEKNLLFCIFLFYALLFRTFDFCIGTHVVYLQFTQKTGFLTLFTKKIKNHEIEKCMEVVFKKNRTDFLFLQQAYNFLYA